MMLDYIEQYQYKDDESTGNYEARMALARLAAGMRGLHKDVMKVELQMRRKAEKDNVKHSLVGGVLENFPMEYLSCVFQWYTVSACNYVQLVGWLETQDKKRAKSYVKRVIPRLDAYRNKIAAHMSIVNPYPDDNPADQASSLLTQVIYAKGRLCAGALTVSVDTVAGEPVKASQNLSWSLTEEHAQLVNRYWRDGYPDAFQSIMVPAGMTRKISVNYPVIYE